MPWKETDAMSEKYKFVLLCQEPGANISQICQEYGVGRSTGNKWLRRYRKAGVTGLLERSRRPLSSTLEISAEVICQISLLSDGPRKPKAKRIHAQLKRNLPIEQVPSMSTVHRVLVRLGRVEHRRKRRHESMRHDGMVSAENCNDAWTTDLKGWWQTRDGIRCDPLTIRDQASRYLLDLYGLVLVRTEIVKDRFRWCFELYGLPISIWSDNGSPFACTRSLCGLTQLSVWFIKVGITPKRIPKASPWCNGGHERMHLDIANELERRPERDCASQQRAFDLWRIEFNDTPHGYLRDKTPEEVYKRSRRIFNPAEPDYEYPKDFEVRKVDSKGCLFFRNEKYYLSKALSGEYVGFEQNEKLLKLWFCNFLLGSATLSKPLRHYPKDSHMFRHFEWVK